MLFLIVLVLVYFLPDVGGDNANNQDGGGEYLPLPPRLQENSRDQPNDSTNDDKDAYQSFHDFLILPLMTTAPSVLCLAVSDIAPFTF